MAKNNTPRTVKLTDAFQRARDLGLYVEHLIGTGETGVWFNGKCLKVNERKKDAPKSLMTLLRKAERSTAK